MTAVAMFALASIGVLLCAGSLLLLVQATASLSAPRRLEAAQHAPSFVVLVPAHDEEPLIEATVRSARQSAGPTGRVLVVADNCTDATAARARAAGAEVVERHDPARRGKAHALAFGIEHLRGERHDVVVVLDADCRCTRGGLALLAACAAQATGPVQAMNLMSAYTGAGLNVRIAAFAWAFRNSVRARGYAALGLPCQLTGTGMAFRRDLLEQVSFTSASLAEDLQLGLRFAAVRRAPVLCCDVHIDSTFAQNATGQRSQRRRWEHGHLQTIASVVPRLVVPALRTRNAALLAMLADAAIPPLALFGLLAAAYAVLAAALAWLDLPRGPVVPLAAVSAAAFGAAVLVGWWQVGRRWVSGLELLAAPLYVVRKIPLYVGYFRNRQAEWTRTRRDP